MRVWSVKFEDLEVFTHLQGEAFSQAQEKSINTEGVWQVMTYHLSDTTPRGELLALCLNHKNWATCPAETLASFENGKRLRS